MTPRKSPLETLSQISAVNLSHKLTFNLLLEYWDQFHLQAAGGPAEQCVLQNNIHKSTGGSQDLIMAFHLHINEKVEILSLKESKVFPHSTSHLIWQIEVKCEQIYPSQWGIQTRQDMQTSNVGANLLFLRIFLKNCLK